TIVSKGDTYSSDIIKEMKDAKLIIVEGTLYPLLTRLKNAGLLSYKWEESTLGPPRKYYRITDEGISFLSDLVTTWNELVNSVNIINKTNLV
ncbi:MAG: PadR family transcriptional regulator, partial [Bacteroidetes bacterium GWA2_30_7]